MNKRKDVFGDDENFKAHEVSEEMEFYDMSAFEATMVKRLDQLETKIDALIEESEATTNAIRGIQFQYRRRMFIRLAKWLIIFGLLYYAYANFIQPFFGAENNIFNRFGGMVEEFKGESSEGESFGETFDRLFPNASGFYQDLQGNTVSTTTEATSTEETVEN